MPSISSSTSREAFVGSQNFDWRVAVPYPGDRPAHPRAPFCQRPAAYLRRRLEFQRRRCSRLSRPGACCRPWLSPPRPAWWPARLACNPPGVGEALEALVAAIDNARSRVTVQLLSYSLETGGGEKFLAIDQALRRAAGRDVGVRLLVCRLEPAGVPACRAEGPGPGAEHRGQVRRHSAGEPRLHPLRPRRPFQGHARRRRPLLGGNEQLGT